MRKLTAAALVCCLALSACGSASQSAHKSLDHEIEIMRKRVDALAVSQPEINASATTSGTVEHKRAVIAAALRSFERRVEREHKQIEREYPNQEINVGYSPKPPVGISEGEWRAAMKADHRLQRLFRH